MREEKGGKVRAEQSVKTRLWFDGGHLGESSASPWQELFFNPVYLSRFSEGDDSQSITADVSIGPISRLPLKLMIPVMIAGIGYGSGGVSEEVKRALAMGATMTGTATNTGAGPVLASERSAAEKLIIQYARGSWSKDLEALRGAEAIEIRLGTEMWGTGFGGLCPRRLARNPQLWETIRLEGKKAVVPPRLLGIKDQIDLGRLIETLRRKTNGIPIGVKIGATQWLERELALIADSGPDYLAIEGLEAGGPSKGIRDRSLGIPTLYATYRADEFLREHNLRHKISLLVGGGLRTSMEILKAMALGADAVFIGTAALKSLFTTRRNRAWRRSFPWFFSNHWLGGKEQAPWAAQNLADFLKMVLNDMRLVAFSLGKRRLQDITRDDLSTSNRELAAVLKISWCGQASAPSNSLIMEKEEGKEERN